MSKHRLLGGTHTRPNGDSFETGEIMEDLADHELEVLEGRIEPVPDFDEDEEPEEPTLEVTPAAEELAEEYGIDVDEIEGSGKQGRVLKGDVEDVLEEMTASEPEADESEAEEQDEEPAEDEEE